MPCEKQKQTMLFREGEPGEAMYLLVRGRISLHKLSPEGRETVIKVIKPGEVFAEVILFEQKQYPVTALALTEILVFKLLRRDLLGLLRRRISATISSRCYCVSSAILQTESSS